MSGQHKSSELPRGKAENASSCVMNSVLTPFRTQRYVKLSFCSWKRLHSCAYVEYVWISFVRVDVVIWRNQWLLLFVCHPSVSTFVQLRKACPHSGEDWKWESLRVLYSDSDSLASGAIEEQRAVCYIKYLHSVSTVWRAGEIYNRNLSLSSSGYKPLICFCFSSSFFSSFHNFFAVF